MQQSWLKKMSPFEYFLYRKVKVGRPSMSFWHLTLTQWHTQCHHILTRILLTVRGILLKKVQCKIFLLPCSHIFNLATGTFSMIPGYNMNIIWTCHGLFSAIWILHIKRTIKLDIISLNICCPFLSIRGKNSIYCFLHCFCVKTRFSVLAVHFELTRTFKLRLERYSRTAL